MAEYYKIIKQNGIKLEKVGEPKKNIAGNWSMHVTFWLECPYCNKKDNLLQSGDWAIEGENYLPARSTPSKQCFHCKKDYKPMLIAKCDFSELNKKVKGRENKNLVNETPKPSSKQIEENNSLEQEEEYEESSFSNPEEDDSSQKKTIPGSGIIVATVVFYFISLLLLNFESIRMYALSSLGIAFILLLLSIYINKKTFKEYNEPLTIGSISFFTLFQFWGYLGAYSDYVNYEKNNGLINNFLVKVGEKIFIREILWTIFSIVMIFEIPAFGISGLALMYSLIYYRREKNKLLKAMERNKE